jgi:hypothetical protein
LFSSFRRQVIRSDRPGLATYPAASTARKVIDRTPSINAPSSLKGEMPIVVWCCDGDGLRRCFRSLKPWFGDRNLPHIRTYQTPRPERISRCAIQQLPPLPNAATLTLSYVSEKDSRHFDSQPELVKEDIRQEWARLPPPNVGIRYRCNDSRGARKGRGHHSPSGTFAMRKSHRYRIRRSLVSCRPLTVVDTVARH